MFGGSFPVWVGILIVSGLLTAFSAIINPHFSKNDKDKMREYAATHYAHAPPKIYVQYFFNEAVFIFGGVVFSGAALIAFFVQDFGRAVDYYGGSGFDKAAVIIVAIIISIFLPTVFTIIGLAVERSQVRALRADAERRYHVIVEHDSDELF